VNAVLPEDLPQHRHYNGSVGASGRRTSSNR
jgi:hypothetical protein